MAALAQPWLEALGLARVVLTPCGVLAAVRPRVVAPHADELAATAPGVEAAWLRRWQSTRALHAVAGRVALRAALRASGAPFALPLAADPAGAPTAPAGWAASVAHCDRLAVALVAPRARGTLGVDVEPLWRNPVRIGHLVGSPFDDAAVPLGSAPAPRALVRFCLKEAGVKAAAACFARRMGLHEVALVERPRRAVLSAQGWWGLGWGCVVALCRATPTQPCAVAATTATSSYPAVAVHVRPRTTWRPLRRATRADVAVGYLSLRPSHTAPRRA